MKNNRFKRIGAWLLAIVILVGTCVADMGVVKAEETYTVSFEGSNVVFRDSDDKVVNKLVVSKDTDLEINVTADSGYELPDSISITSGVDRYYDKSTGKIKLTGINDTTSVIVNAIKSTVKTVDAYLYYRYSNEVPDKIEMSDNDSKYGPSGNGVSCTKVKVDLNALEKLGYAKGKYTEGYIYSVENSDNTVNYEAANEHNQDGVLKADSKVRDFWADLYSCMDEASQRLVDETYEGKFVGYVIKKTGSSVYKIHIDGILDTPAEPVKSSYQVEIYDNVSGSPVIAKTKVDEVKSKYSDVYTMVEEYLAADAQSFSIEWIDAATALYVKDGKSYSLTLSQRVPGGSSIPADGAMDIEYSAYTPTYNVAIFDIKSKRTSMTCNINVYYNDSQVKTFESGNVKSMEADSVAKYADVKEYVQQLLIGDAQDTSKAWINWNQGIYVKDGALYEFSVETTSATESTDGCVVMPVIDDAGIVYYSSTNTDNDYISDILVKDTRKNVTAVGLYVLKNEASNIFYGYDVDSDSIIGHPKSDFYDFGYAFVDNDYLNSIKKGANSKLIGETITETLYSYDYGDNSFEADGEKYETGKILQYVAFTSNNAKNIVTKINGDYNIMWYVIKKAGGSNDAYTWHIDGYLCKDEAKDEKINVTVTHKLYNNKTGQYELMNNGEDTITEEVPVNKLYSSKSIYPKRKEASSTKITIDGSFTDWTDLPSYWVPAEFNKSVSVSSKDSSSDEHTLENNNLVKIYNDEENQNIYMYMQVSDVYDTYFKTDDFQLSVNNGDFKFRFYLGDEEGNVINGDISNMAPGAYDYFIYDEQGNRISGGKATIVIKTNHFNTSVEICVPYDVVTTDSDDRYYVTGMDKISGTVIGELSSSYYDDDKCLNNNSQLAFEDTELEYRYASIRTVESIQFETINIEGTSTSPYILALICFGIAVSGFFGATYIKKHVAGRN